MRSQQAGKWLVLLPSAWYNGMIILGREQNAVSHIVEGLIRLTLSSHILLGFPALQVFISQMLGAPVNLCLLPEAVFQQDKSRKGFVPVLCVLSSRCTLLRTRTTELGREQETSY